MENSPSNISVMAKKTKKIESIETTMTEALMRSGYMMESRIIRKLVENDFFVEPNQRILDPRTGKTREIDLIAQRWNYDYKMTAAESKVSVLVNFICEAKNNPYPMVLLTELPLSPGLEPWESLHECRTGLFAGHDLETTFYDFLYGRDHKIYTQYCSFKPKKGANETGWMAWHPDDFYDDLEKIISFCKDQAVQDEKALTDDYHRLHLYLPVVILGGDLFIAEPMQEKISLRKVDVARLIHFGVQNQEQSLSLVFFVTERYFSALFDEIVRLGQSLEKTTVERLRSYKP